MIDGSISMANHPAAVPGSCHAEQSIAEARRLGRLEAEFEQIATAMGAALERIMKAPVQMRSPQPDVTLAAHQVFRAERVGVEPLRKTVGRVAGELLQLRAEKAGAASFDVRSIRRSPPQLNQMALLRIG